MLTLIFHTFHNCSDHMQLVFGCPCCRWVEPNTSYQTYSFHEQWFIRDLQCSMVAASARSSACVLWLLAQRFVEQWSGASLVLSFALSSENLYFRLGCLMQPWYEGMYLVLLHLVMLCLVHILGRSAHFYRISEREVGLEERGGEVRGNGRNVGRRK